MWACFKNINSEHEFDQEKKVDIWNNLKKKETWEFKKESE